MAYHEMPADQVRARIRSTRGETIDLALPDTCTVGELRTFLIDEYKYNPNTRLLFNNAAADDAATVTSFPYGSLLIATPDDMAELARQQPQAGQALNQAAGGAQSVGARSQAQASGPPQQRSMPMANESPGKQNRIPQHQSHMAAQLHRNHAQHGNHSGTDATADRRRTRSNENNKHAQAPPRQAQQPSQRQPDKAGGTHSTTANTNTHQSSLPLRRGSTNAFADNGNTPGTGTGTSGPATFQEARPQPPQQQWGPSPSQAQNPPVASPSVQNDQAPRTTPPAQPADTIQQPQQQQTPRTAAQANTAPSCGQEEEGGGAASALEFAHWREISFTVECVIPAAGAAVQLQVTADCSVAALALAITEAVPQLRGVPFQIVLRGRILQQTESNILFNLGMRRNCRVYVASGAYSNIDTIVLLEIKEDIGRIEAAIQQPLTDELRKGYYEELMRMLLRTDGLQELDAEWRKKRKETVAHIQRLQDSLGIQNPHT